MCRPQSADNIQIFALSFFNVFGHRSIFLTSKYCQGLAKYFEYINHGCGMAAMTMPHGQCSKDVCFRVCATDLRDKFAMLCVCVCTGNSRQWMIRLRNLIEGIFAGRIRGKFSSVAMILTPRSRVWKKACWGSTTTVDNFWGSSLPGFPAAHPHCRAAAHHPRREWISNYARFAIRYSLLPRWCCATLHVHSVWLP